MLVFKYFYDKMALFNPLMVAAYDPRKVSMM